MWFFLASKPQLITRTLSHITRPMSKFLANSWQAVETVPPRLISIDRRPTLERRLETIQEESDGQGCKGKQIVMETPTVDFSKRRPSANAQ
ncbi:hypothetical protein AAC387_Pa05g2803 [Persea americana]